MENQKKIIRIKAGMSDPKGKLIPRGVQEQITIEIADEVAVYFFRNKNVTKNFATIEIEGDKSRRIVQRTFYLDRTGKAVRKYPGLKKEQIRDKILQQLKELNIKAKIFKNG